MGSKSKKKVTLTARQRQDVELIGEAISEGHVSGISTENYDQAGDGILFVGVSDGKRYYKVTVEPTAPWPREEDLYVP